MKTKEIINCLNQQQINELKKWLEFGCAKEGYVNSVTDIKPYGLGIITCPMVTFLPNREEKGEFTRKCKMDEWHCRNCYYIFRPMKGFSSDFIEEDEDVGICPCSSGVSQSQIKRKVKSVIKVWEK